MSVDRLRRQHGKVRGAVVAPVATSAQLALTAVIAWFLWINAEQAAYKQVRIGLMLVWCR
jgi:hypothetical protein